MRIVINKKTWLLSFIIVFLPLALVLEMKYSTPFVGYADEIFSAIMALYLLKLALERKLDPEDMKLVALLAVFVVIGLISNFNSRLLNNVFLIALDAFWQCKILLSYLGAKYLARLDRTGSLLKGLVPICKLLILSAFVCGLLSFVVDLGMTDGYRYGIPAFSFIFVNHGRYGIIIAVALMIILAAEPDPRKNGWFVFMGVMDMIFSTKGVVYVIIPVFFLLWLVFSKVEREGKIKPWLIVFVALAGVSVSGYQITEYLLDPNAPRALLLQYGFITANNYFPLGSGFGTYGSDVASSYTYSPLYVQYGWAEKWSMGIEYGSALNDAYLGSIVGQCGYFGLLVFLYILYKIYTQVNKARMVPRSKAMLLSLLVCMLVTFLATGITKSSIGILTFIVMGVVVSDAERRRSLDT